MNSKIVFILGFMMLLGSSCGPKITPSSDTIIKQSESYAETINNQNLEKKINEGALTDVSGFKDIGSFKLTYYYNKTNKELLRIENIETANKVRVENFYFQNGKLTYVSSKTNNEPLKQLLFFNGRILKASTVHDGYQDILLDKARMYNKEFNKMMK